MKKIGEYEIDENKILAESIPNEFFKQYKHNVRFLISNQARCYDMEKNRFVKDYKPKNGSYHVWYLCDYNVENAQQYAIPIHQAVAEMWVEKPTIQERLVIDHIDGCKYNNISSNLRYITYSENARAQDVQKRKSESLKKTNEHNKKVKVLTDILVDVADGKENTILIKETDEHLKNEIIFLKNDITSLIKENSLFKKCLVTLGEKIAKITDDISIIKKIDNEIISDIVGEKCELNFLRKKIFGHKNSTKVTTNQEEDLPF